MDCVPILMKKGYNLNGYSFDTIFYLRNNDMKNEDESEA